MEDRFNNCKSDPCLKERLLTLENFVEGAYCGDRISNGYIYKDGKRRCINFDHGQTYSIESLGDPLEYRC